jgi:FlaA1/EpsC-like NDP-sugar epimerase
MKTYLSNRLHPVLAWPRYVKRAAFMIVDAILCLLSVWLSFYLRIGEIYTLINPILFAAFVSVALLIPLFTALDIYRVIFRYSGFSSMLNILKAMTIYGFVYASIFTVIGYEAVPRTVGLIQPIVLFVLVAGLRVLPRIWLQSAYFAVDDIPRALIYGAGSAGRQLIAALKTSEEVALVGLLDDDDRLHGNVLDGLKIFNPAEVMKVVNKLAVTHVYLAMPSISRSRRNQILESVRGGQVQVRTLPSVMDLARGNVHVADLKSLDIEDLLGRDPVPPNPLMLSKNIADRVVMVTGAGGSIGSELCRQILSLDPTTLLLVDASEYALYTIHQELQQITPQSNSKVNIIPLLANVKDELRISEILSAWHPSTVYHAAAYKHVPLVEHNPAEGIRNNVFGTLVLASQSVRFGVSDFVLISTDKAVRPTNIMGASKRYAEMILQAIASTKPTTKFSMVRFGNVLGSSGSVVPLFRQQIKEGGPITLTDERITRYFMTIPEAAQLVIQSGSMALGGDVFVLDMGEPVKIVELARRMVELSGLSLKNVEYPMGDIEICVTGLRPGEKLYEELLIGDNPLPTSHPRIMKANEDFLAWEVLDFELAKLEVALSSNDVQAVRDHLKSIIQGYQPDGAVVDWIYLNKDHEYEKN